MDNRLPKRERISKRNDIERLFRNGEAFLVYPVKCTYLKREGSPDAPESGCDRVLVMASKRNQKRAVDRNRMKRRMREAYRLNKGLFMDDSVAGQEKIPGYDIALSYIAKGGVLLEYRVIEEAVRKILKRLWEHRNKAKKPEEGNG